MTEQALNGEKQDGNLDVNFHGDRSKLEPNENGFIFCIRIFDTIKALNC